MLFKKFQVIPKVLISFILLSLPVLTGCKKESNQKACWQVVDNLGNNLFEVCNKTETELIACMKDGSCSNGYTQEITNCNYIKEGGEKFCWIINNRYYNNFTQNEVDHLLGCYLRGYTAVKANCDDCQNWYSRKKSTYIPGGNFVYSPVTFATYCGDSAHLIANSGQIIIKSDADSLIVIQFSFDGITWH